MANPLLTLAGEAIREAPPKQIALSGPAGFLGSRVLGCILDAHDYRRAHGLEPGEVVLLSSSPGNLMSRLTNQYGNRRMATVRATRVDYYFQHDLDSWRDQLGSLGMGAPTPSSSTSPRSPAASGSPDAMMAVNYAHRSPPRACGRSAGHWIQSSRRR